MIRQLTSPNDLAAWDAWVNAHPQGNLWQSAAWKHFQEKAGRTTRVYVQEENGAIVVSALVVIDATAMGLSAWEIPRGPIVSEERRVKSEELMEAILADARQGKCMVIYASPPVPFFTLHSSLFTSSRRHVHPEATRILDLTLDDQALLAQMSQKGRYNIRLAQKHGVMVAESRDADAFAALAAATGKRDGFVPHSAAHYRAFLEHLPGSFLLLAYAPEAPQKAIAGLLGVVWNAMGIYYYGASDHAHRALMAPYLLQWEAMRLCKARGCTRYDLFGIAPDGASDHPWSGVTDFKTKFGGEYVEYPAERMLILKPVMKMALDVKRKLLG